MTPAGIFEIVDKIKKNLFFKMLIFFSSTICLETMQLVANNRYSLELCFFYTETYARDIQEQKKKEKERIYTSPNETNCWSKLINNLKMHIFINEQKLMCLFLRKQLVDMYIWLTWICSAFNVNDKLIIRQKTDRP